MTQYNKTPEDVLIIALAAFMHDIGKFAERAKHDGYSDIKPTDEFLNKRETYQPKRSDGKDSHVHALYTAYVVENLLQSSILKIEADKETFINMAARHHIQDNAWRERIITVADKLSAKTDRQKFEDASKDIKIKDYAKTRLMSIFDEIKGGIENYDDRRFQYSLSPLSAESIFPKERDDFTGTYKELFSQFWQKLSDLKIYTDIEAWFKTFDKLNKEYTYCVPSATVKDVITDVSLYDHARTTSALASALYVYHKKDEKENKSALEDNETKKFLFTKIKFHGIQDFIFSQGAVTNKKSAKILRGRSYYISLLMEKAADLLCRNCGLPHTSIIMNAAGAITAILPNTDEIKEKIAKTETGINKWLVEKFYGEVSVGFAYVEFAGKDITEKGGVKKLGENIAKKLEIKKFQKLSIDSLGVVGDYFQNGEKICDYCGKRPTASVDDECLICKDLTEIGTRLVKDKKECKLESPIFGIFDTVELNSSAAYVPKNDEGDVKGFEKITGDDVKGINGLAVLKADIDNLGTLFADGISKPDTSLSKQATFSRQLDAFFTVWLPSELKENKKFSDVYTVFAGGDDLFLIGKWDTIIDLSLHLKEKFKEYFCGNVNFSAGIAVLKPNEPIKTFYRLSEEALSASKAHNVKEKNALTLFGETISWANSGILSETDEKIKELIEDQKINSAGLVKLMAFIKMAKEEEDVKNKANTNKLLSIKDFQCFKWRALLNYYIGRNDKIKEQSDKQSLINYFVEMIEKKEKRGILKAALWKNIYQNRQRGK
ncbi:MAG: type III-A CRISPR-associated protein Cas10/Csm1 [Endomicrobium sp.]|jgi:CRISPR-associated protein Csm1|nr:type III-A CRISPR-associated protein Cas10/Csm1 [Endomicrobium sp.]